MGAEPLKRKLAATLYADVAGYSRRTGEDEEGTHRALSAYLNAITDSVERHNGKVLHFAGDAVLADFTTVSNALTCTAAVQQDLKLCNQEFIVPGTRTRSAPLQEGTLASQWLLLKKGRLSPRA